jgi:predicted flap endonuclease-1-like 5' DNA nuclease
MTMLFLQTLLMMLAAYFVGAAIACGLRKLITPARHASAARMEGATRTVEPLPQAARASAPETVSRFEKALVSEPPRPAPAPVPQQAVPTQAVPTQAVPTQAVAPPPRVTPVAPIAAAVTAAPAKTVAPAAAIAVATPIVARAPTHAPIEAPHPVPPSELVVPPPPRITLTAPETPATSSVATDVTVTPAGPMLSVDVARPVAAAMAAAAAAATVAVTKVAAAPAPATAAPLAATGATVVAPTATVTAATVPAADDDLTRIRGIDRPIADSLRAMGVTRYAQIAGWMRPDVTRVNQSMGFKHRVEQQNWIEQAQILANRGDTLFSRRLSKPTVTTVQPVAVAAMPAAASVVAAAVAAQAPAATTPASVAPIAARPPTTPQTPSPLSAVTAGATAPG